MNMDKVYKVIYLGNVHAFEEQLLYNSEQEITKGKPGYWCHMADMYVRQLIILSFNPYPEEGKSQEQYDKSPPSIEHIYQNTELTNLYRWALPGGSTGNHRIIFVIHNYHKVILLHYFNKKYNGAISRNDLIPAEVNYDYYCFEDPNLY